MKKNRESSIDGYFCHKVHGHTTHSHSLLQNFKLLLREVDHLHGHATSSP